MTISEKKSVGLVGLGLLGAAIGQRLIDNGYSVTGYDVASERVAEFRQSGGIGASSFTELLQTNRRILLCLPTSDVVESIVRQYKGDFSAGHIVVDTTTGDPQQMLAISKRLDRLQTRYVEANVAGSSTQMREGKATLLVGGDMETVNQLELLFTSLSQQYFHLGPIGAGSKMKLVHNLVLGLNRAVLAEGLIFADSLGIAPKQALEILKQTPAASAVMQTKGQRMVNQDFDPQARLAQHRKDVGLILAEAERADLQTPLSTVHQQLLDRAIELGLGELDNSSIIEAFRKLDGSRQ